MRGSWPLRLAQEQSSFSPSNILPGISWSPDKMLQSRIFSYADAHRYWVGAHYESLPMNRPAHHYHLDGAVRFDAPPDRMPSTGA